MPTLFDLDVLTVLPTEGSAKARTMAWTLLGGGAEPMGFVTQQVGSALALARRYLGDQRYAYRQVAMFDVVDTAGGRELVITRRPARWKTRLTLTCALADGTVVAMSSQQRGRFPSYRAADANGNPSADIVLTDASTYSIIEPGGRPLGVITHNRITKSLIRPDGRTGESYAIEYRPEASTLVRMATLGTLVAQSSRRAR